MHVYIYLRINVYIITSYALLNLLHIRDISLKIRHARYSMIIIIKYLLPLYRSRFTINFM